MADIFCARDVLAHVVPLCLMELLSVGDLFRLRIALGLPYGDEEAVARLVGERMSLRRTYTLASLGQRMALGRCRECGTASRRQVAVCGVCADGDTYFALRDRDFIRQVLRAASKRKLEHYIRHRMRPATRCGWGRLLYWRADVVDARHARGV